jgi:hypothetical protein
VLHTHTAQQETKLWVVCNDMQEFYATKGQRTAIHECGHVVVGRYLQLPGKLTKVSVCSRAMSLIQRTGWACDSAVHTHWHGASLMKPAGGTATMITVAMAAGA